MQARDDVIFLYDGSYDGLLCAVFRCYTDGILPYRITDTRDTMLEYRTVETDPDKAARVARGVRNTIGAQAERMMRRAYLSDFDDRGAAVARFVVFGMQHGAATMKMLAQPCVHRLHAISRAVANEAHRNIEFLRFSEINGALVSVIRPTHNVLPLIAQHFVERFPNERLFLYDKVHKIAFRHEGACDELLRLEGFEPGPIDDNEASYRALWETFYNAIEIRPRHNERCRLNHMPLRFWEDFMYKTRR